MGHCGPSSMQSTDFGKGRVCIRAAVTTAPPWFPVGVVVVMSVEFPTRLDPTAFCVALVGVAMVPPTRWGPNVPVAVSVSGILFVVLVGLCATIALFYVCIHR